MICQEVIELMQRDMDGDLDQQEKLLMMDHVGECSDCAAMLTRLQKLSNELEQLPRVVPKFSLVDAILPELERLHVSETAGGSPERENDTRNNVTPSRSASRSHRSNRYLLGKISGVVAAGIVAGVLLFGDPGQWTLGRSGSNNEAAAPNLMSVSTQESSMLMSKRVSESTGDNAASAESIMDAQDRNLDIADQAGNASPAAPAAPESGEAAPDPGTQPRQDAAIQPKDSEQGMMGITGFEETPASDENPANVNDQVPKAMAAIPATLSESPDGKWRVIGVEGTGIFEVHATADDSLYYASQPREGSISLMEWNEASTVLFFTFTDVDGKQTQWQFDTITAQETVR